MKSTFGKKVLFLILLGNILLIFNVLGVGVLHPSIQNTSLNLINEQDITITEFNNYYPDGNISVLVAVDTHLLGEDKWDVIKKPTYFRMSRSWIAS